MKNTIITLVIALNFNAVSWAQSSSIYKTITVVESIVPNGLGRSRMISSDEQRIIKNLLVLEPVKMTNEINLIEATFA